MSRLPRWAADATRPTDAEIASVIPPEPGDPRITLARRATSPRAGEVERLIARRTGVRRGRVSPLWLGVPLAAALGLFAARQGLERARDGLAEGAAVEALMVGSPEELVPGVFVDGRGRAAVDGDGAVRLDGVYRVVTSVEVGLRLGGDLLEIEPGEVHVAGGTLAVVRGTVRAPDGRYLVPGDTWSAEDPAGAVAAAGGDGGADPVAEAPAGPPVAVVRRPVRAPPLAALGPETAPAVSAPVGSAPVEAAPAVAPPAEVPPEGAAPAEAAPSAPDPLAAPLADWRALLDARDAGLAPAALSARLEAHAARWPGSPFAGEALALAALQAVALERPEAALARLEGRLAAAPSGPRQDELHAAAARVARDGLADCARALPHDLWLANRGPRAGRPAAAALAGLCELHLGRAESGAARLGRLDPQDLPPDLADAVIRALEAP